MAGPSRFSAGMLMRGVANLQRSLKGADSAVNLPDGSAGGGERVNLPPLPAEAYPPLR